jgi:hypothetical protein
MRTAQTGSRLLASASAERDEQAVAFSLHVGSGLQAEVRARDASGLAATCDRGAPQAKTAKGQACTFRPGFFPYG